MIERVGDAGEEYAAMFEGCDEELVSSGVHVGDVPFVELFLIGEDDAENVLSKERVTKMIDMNRE